MMNVSAKKFDLEETMELTLITVILERAMKFMREESLKGNYPPRRTDDEGEIIPCFCNCQDIMDELRAYSVSPAVARTRLANAVHGAAALINYHFNTFGTHHVEMGGYLCDRTGKSGIVGFYIK